MDKKYYKKVIVSTILIFCLITFMCSFQVKATSKSSTLVKNNVTQGNKIKSKNSNVSSSNAYINYNSKTNSKKNSVSVNKRKVKSKTSTVVANKTQTSASDNYTNNYKVIVKIGNETVDIYENNNLIKEMSCSTGTNEDPTPIGTYYTGSKGYSFFSNKYNEGAYYWTSFLGNYLFHSIPFDSNGNIINSEAQKLGSRASHGCVRLSMENAKWFYDTIPENTSVIVEN